MRTWFLAIYLLTQRKQSVPAPQLPRDLGVSYNTAWRLKRKILQVMDKRCKGKHLSGRIEIDDACSGGERPGKRGQGKVRFIVAVKTSKDGRPFKTRFRRVSGLTHVALKG